MAVAAPQYNAAHRARRRALLDAMREGTPCPLCGVPMSRLRPDLIDADHTVPHALGGRVADRLICRRCNRGRFNRMRAALTSTFDPADEPMPIQPTKRPPWLRQVGDGHR